MLFTQKYEGAVAMINPNKDFKNVAVNFVKKYKLSTVRTTVFDK